MPPATAGCHKPMGFEVGLATIAAPALPSLFFRLGFTGHVNSDFGVSVGFFLKTRQVSFVEEQMLRQLCLASFTVREPAVEDGEATCWATKSVL